MGREGTRPCGQGCRRPESILSVGAPLLASLLLFPAGLILAPFFAPLAERPEVIVGAGLGAVLLTGTTRIRHPNLNALQGLPRRVRCRMKRTLRYRGPARAEAKLDRLANFLDLAPQLALETDAQGRILYLGGRLCERWSRLIAAGTPRGRPSHQLVAPEHFQEYSAFLNRLLQGGDQGELDLALRPEGGCDIPVRVQGVGVPDERTGSVQRVRMVFTDITAEVQGAANQSRALERSLLAANRKLTGIIEFLPDATFVIDDEGRVVAWNRAMEELSGIPKEEMIGQGDHAYAIPFYGERLPILIDHFNDAYGFSLDERYYNVEAGRDAICAETFIPFLNEGRGAYLWATASPLFDSEGRIVGAIESLRDITDRRNSEVALRTTKDRYRALNEELERRIEDGTHELRTANAALRASEARYRRIVENLREGHIFYSHDPHGTYNYVSPSCTEVLGCDGPEGFVRMMQAALERPENRPARDRAEQGRLGHKQSSYDLVVEHSHGGPRILEILEVPVFGARGEVESVEGLCRDVTEVRRNLELVRETQQQLVESSKMAALGTLVAGLSHEINTPVGLGVTAVSHLAVTTRSCLDRYREGQLTRSAFEDFLQTSHQTVDLLQTNLNRAADLLQNFKQVAVDQSAGQPRVFELGEYLEDVIRSFGPRLKGSGFVLSHTCEPDLHLHCDPGALYQIISNLVMNSLTHAFEGLLVGEMRLAAWAADGAIRLEYRDNGNGMTREVLTRLYEPFYTTRRGRGGTGLGMHIVYNNVTQVLGGSITCTSRLGRGTRFVIEIPLRAEASHA